MHAYLYDIYSYLRGCTDPPIPTIGPNRLHESYKMTNGKILVHVFDCFEPEYYFVKTREENHTSGLWFVLDTLTIDELIVDSSYMFGEYVNILMTTGFTLSIDEHGDGCYGQHDITSCLTHPDYDRRIENYIEWNYYEK